MLPGTTEETVIEAVIAPAGSGTQLVVEERGIPLPELPAWGAGWQVHLEDLHTRMAGRDPGDWPTRTSRLKPTYEDLATTLA